MKSSYTLETIEYQLVTHKKCKMAVKAHALFYKRKDGEETKKVYKLYTFFVACNVLVMQRLTDRRVINAVCEPSYSVCTLHLSRVQRLLKNAPTRDEAADKIAVYRVKSSFSSLF